MHIMLQLSNLFLFIIDGLPNVSRSKLLHGRLPDTRALWLRLHGCLFKWTPVVHVSFCLPMLLLFKRVSKTLRAIPALDTYKQPAVIVVSVHIHIHTCCSRFAASFTALLHLSFIPSGTFALVHLCSLDSIVVKKRLRSDDVLVLLRHQLSEFRKKYLISVTGALCFQVFFVVSPKANVCHGLSEAPLAAALRLELDTSGHELRLCHLASVRPRLLNLAEQPNLT